VCGGFGSLRPTHHAPAAALHPNPTGRSSADGAQQTQSEERSEQADHDVDHRTRPAEVIQAQMVEVHPREEQGHADAHGERPEHDREIEVLDGVHGSAQEVHGLQGNTEEQEVGHAEHHEEGVEPASHRAGLHLGGNRLGLGDLAGLGRLLASTGVRLGRDGRVASREAVEPRVEDVDDGLPLEALAADADDEVRDPLEVDQGGRVGPGVDILRQVRGHLGELALVVGEPLARERVATDLAAPVGQVVCHVCSPFGRSVGAGLDVRHDLSLPTLGRSRNSLDRCPFQCAGISRLAISSFS